MTWLDRLADWVARLRSWFLVRPWELAIRVRAGRWVRPYGPGLWFCVPFLDEVFVQSTRMRVLNLPVQTVESKDGKIISVSGVVRWRVGDVARMYQRLQTPEDWIYNEVMTAIAETVSNLPWDSRREDGSRMTGPKELGDIVGNVLARRARALGVRIKGVSITDLAPVRTLRLITGEGNSHVGNFMGTLDRAQGARQEG